MMNAERRVMNAEPRVMKAGHRVIFDGPNSFIENKWTGERTWMKEENGVYCINVWVKPTGFTWPGHE